MNNLFIIGIACINFLLFIGKFYIGILSHSTALISDAINSFTDTINSLVVLFATIVSQKPADKSHPGGHYQAQPIAAFFIAIMTAVLAIEIIKEAIIKIIHPTAIEHHTEAIFILLATIIIKGGISYFEYQQGKKHKNRALIAMSVESRGDMLISFAAIIGISCSIYYNILWIDPLIAIVISLYIFYTAYTLMKENIDFLMGASASPEEIKKITDILNNNKNIHSYHDLRTQYFGEKVQITVHCHIYEKHSIQEWHDIEAEISKELETLENVQKAFIHLDPIE
jgi:cation diffusion facilitator family transporter